MARPYHAGNVDACQTNSRRGHHDEGPRGVAPVAQERRRVGSVSYEEAGDHYFVNRRLRRHAAFWSLGSLGVAAVISGDFYGWNLGLDAGGFGGLLIATVFIAIMYYGLCFSIAEMSPALPHTGGGIFVRPLGDGAVGRV